MNCTECPDYLSFDGHKGINEVQMDGVCTKNGKGDPHLWKPITNPAFNGCDKQMIREQMVNLQHGPLGIPAAKGNITQILDNAKADIDKRKVQGECGNCANWKRAGFTNSGECWKQGVKQHGVCVSSYSCTDFYARPNNKGQAGDIVTITVGDKWKVLFVGSKHVLCVDQQGNEKVFDQAGLRFDKC